MNNLGFLLKKAEKQEQVKSRQRIKKVSTKKICTT